ncbi:hypothetical protein JCM15519_31010 [Fundidesulfovibrio butyratiphilus]
MDNSDFLESFIEDTREHLDDIETNLMDLEQAGDNASEELVNTVFRAAHSIKGSAGFLGLSNVRDLAHKLENILHMARNREIVIDKRIVSSLLSGFDRLKSLVAMGAKSEEENIEANLAELAALTEDLLPEERKDQQNQSAQVSLPGGPMIFSPDLLSLKNALSGGKFLYLVEYDLIHDVHARGKTPLDIIRTMESSGLIVDCRVDLGPVGDLDAPLSNKLPFYVLFATIVEPDVVGYLFALDSSCIHLLDPETFFGKPEAADQPRRENLFGFEALVNENALTLSGPEELTLDALGDLRQALMAALARNLDAVLDVSRTVSVDTALVQLLCAAHRSFIGAGRSFSLSSPTAPVLAERLARLGFCAATIEHCGQPTCPFPA